MCGICGVAGAGNRHPVGEATLVAMRDALEHRGPDDAGHHLSPGVALGSRRLAILDLSRRGRMPMSTPVQTRCRRLLSRTRKSISPAAATRATRAAFSEASTNTINHWIERSDMFGS